MQHTCDIVVIGAGPAGLSFAAAAAPSGLNILLIEQSSQETLANPPYDGREIALTHPSRGIMEKLGLWQHIPAEGIYPLKAAKVINGSSPYTLNFPPPTDGKGQLGFLVSNHDIRRAAYQAASQHENIHFLTGHKVQEAVNRIQSYEETKEVIDAAREAGFKSVSVDLIYGLPHQNTESIKTTIDTVLSLDPDRLALYHYAHLPHIFKPQRRIDTNVVPGSEEKLDMLQYCVQTLTERGYVFIGMDHFAKPDDELSIALKEGFLQRNFQGYSTYADCDLVAIGVSSIGKIGSTYSQNERDIDAYYAALDAGHLPIMRGYQLNQDDILRRNIIQDLMCRFSLDYRIYESVFGIPFSRYFAVELEDMKQLETLGLVRLKPHGLTVTPKGRFLIRNIAMVFDYHLRHKETKAKYSQTV